MLKALLLLLCLTFACAPELQRRGFGGPTQAMQTLTARRSRARRRTAARPCPADTGGALHAEAANGLAFSKNL